MKTGVGTALGAILAAAAAVSIGAQVNAPASLAWQTVRNGPMGGNVTDLIETYEQVLIARADGVLYRSTDDGRTWVQCRRLTSLVASPSQPPREPSGGWLWSSIARSETGPSGAPRDQLQVTDQRCEAFGVVTVPAGSANAGFGSTPYFTPVLTISQAGVFRSPDSGRTWALTMPLSSNPVCATHDVMVSGTLLYRSSDSGVSWTPAPADAGAAQSGVAASGMNPGLQCPLLRSSNWHTVYARGPGGLWRSTDQGVTWTRVFAGTVTTFASTEKRLWILTAAPDGPSLMRSDDEGASWTTLPFLRESRVAATRLVDTIRGTLLAATASGVFRSEDRGRSWTRTGFYRWQLSLAGDRRRVYASDGSGVWTSVDGGDGWSKGSNTVDGRQWGPQDALARVFDAGDERVFGTVNRRLLVSDDAGTTWRTAGLDRDVLSIVRVGSTWYAGAVGGLSAGTGGGVFRSSDLSSWVECSSGVDGGPVLAIGGDLLVYSARSTDGCRSWWQLQTDLPRTSNYGPAGPLVFRTPSGDVLSLGQGITRFDLTTRRWEQVKEPKEITVTSAAEGRGRYWMGTAQGVYMLQIDGTDWQVWPMGLDGERIVSLTVDPKGYVVASVEGRGLFRAALP